MDVAILILVVSCFSMALNAQELVMMVTQKHTISSGVTYRGVIYKFDMKNNTLTLFNASPHLTPTAIDYDSVDKRIYWSDISTEKINSADLDAKNHVVVASVNNISFVEGIVIDSKDRKLFYTDKGNKVIVRIDLVTGFPKTEIVTGLNTPWGITVDKINKRIYWVDHQNNKIESCDYNGDGRRNVTSSVNRPSGIALNEKTGRLYWCEYGGKVYSILTDGSSRRLIHEKTLGQIAQYMDLTLYNGFLYVADRLNRRVLVFSESTSSASHGILNNIYFRDITGISLFSPHSPETGCEDGRYGTGCTGVCGRCSLDTHCEKTIGFCLSGCEAGYQGHKCVDVCTPGTYGANCSSTCGNCKTGITCDHVTGRCASGCQMGFRGDRCDERGCLPRKYDNGYSCVPCGRCKSPDVCSSRTGACPRGCEAGWMGSNCRSGCPINKYGENCARRCGFCRTGDVCDPVSGRCPNGCFYGWTGSLCQLKGTGAKSGRSGENGGSVRSGSSGFVPLFVAALLIMELSKCQLLQM